MHENPYRVESVDRAMLLLSMLLDRESLSATEAANELEVAPSTAHRLLTTMCDRGFVRQGASKLYHPGPELLRGASLGTDRQLLSVRLRPVMAELFEALGETVHLLTLAGTDVRFLDGIEGTQVLRVGLRIGMVLPALRTSGGKALLAEYSDEHVRQLHAEVLASQRGSSATSLDLLLRELAEIRGRGVAQNLEESEPGVAALGVAVPGPGGVPVAGIAVAAPTTRYDESFRARAVPLLLQARERAAAALRA